MDNCQQVPVAFSGYKSYYHKEEPIVFRFSCHSGSKLGDYVAVRSVGDYSLGLCAGQTSVDAGLEQGYSVIFINNLTHTGSGMYQLFYVTANGFFGGVSPPFQIENVDMGNLNNQNRRIAALEDGLRGMAKLLTSSLNTNQEKSELRQCPGDHSRTGTSNSEEIIGRISKDNASLRDSIRELKRTCQELQRKANTLEEQKKKLEAEYNLLRTSSAERIASLTQEVQSTTKVPSKKDQFSFDGRDFYPLSAQNKNIQPCDECTKLRSKLKQLQLEKVEISNQLIQVNHSNTLNMRLLSESNQRCADLKMTVQELKGILSREEKH